MKRECLSAGIAQNIAAVVQCTEREYGHSCMWAECVKVYLGGNQMRFMACSKLGRVLT